MEDGLYQITTRYFCAAFEVRDGKVKRDRCAPILRANLKRWKVFAVRVASLVLACCLMSCTMSRLVDRGLASTAPTVRAYGWVGDAPDKRVRMMALRDWPIQTPAPSSNLTKSSIPALDQGRIGSCVGHGTALAWSIRHHAQTGKHLPLSRLMIYYNAREKEGYAHADTGCQIVDAVGEMVRLGACDERWWPYIESKFAVKPPPCRYAEALKHRVVRSYKVDNTDGRSIRLALTNGHPVVFGSLVYSGIQTLTRHNDVLPMPRRGERYTGGHCMVIIGHDDARRLYLIQNSWGEAWGNQGRAWFPYDYIHRGDITEDCWVIEEVMP